ncbi:cytochrome b [uncultured Marinobacter sp.]|uniref:cytochrome b n=1 Tax=uncultured Marinobacter sp. TaxID=187379 RepID=UPI002621578D|nr:cytochrome b [uncultured Marinobacter sp.]
MQVRNSSSNFGAVSIVVHWLVAFTVFGLFGLGYYMVGLSYYDDWYRLAPDIHRSLGILLFLVVLFRVVWRFANPAPEPLPSHTRWEVTSAHFVHVLLYILLFVAMVSGYLISTADGSSISVFNWFEVPSVTGQVKGMEDIAGDIHYWATWAIVIVASLHALAAVKHHILDKDNTLRRMLGVSR